MQNHQWFFIHRYRHTLFSRISLLQIYLKSNIFALHVHKTTFPVRDTLPWEEPRILKPNLFLPADLFPVQERVRGPSSAVSSVCACVLSCAPRLASTHLDRKSLPTPRQTPFSHQHQLPTPSLPRTELTLLSLSLTTYCCITFSIISNRLVASVTHPTPLP